MIYKDDELTDWSQLGEVPQHVGEYNASASGMKELLRWWDGKNWSDWYADSAHEDNKVFYRGCKCAEPKSLIRFRGLKVKPKGFKS